MATDPVIPLAEAVFEPSADLDRLRRRAFAVGAVAAVAAAIGAVASPAAFYRAYLQGWLLWVGVAAGLLALGMLSHVAGGSWGGAMRRVFEAAGRTLPLFLLLFVPIALDLERLYPWADPAIASHEPLIQHKAAYLNAPFFLLRTAFYFGVWWLLARFLTIWSHRQDETGDPGVTRRMRRLSAGGLVVYVLTATAASVDWVMSLDPEWFSSLFGMAFIVGTGLSALAFVVPAVLFLRRRRPFDRVLRTKELHDFGKLTLAFIMLWTYFMISQYLIIWSGNLPEEITWYLARSHGGWQTLTVVLILGHFALPFFVLLSRDVTKHGRRLVWASAWVFVMRWLDLYWQVAPTVVADGAAIHWLDPVIPVAIGGLWLGVMAGQLKGRAAVPVRAPELTEALGHG